MSETSARRDVYTYGVTSIVVVSIPAPSSCSPSSTVAFEMRKKYTVGGLDLVSRL